MSKRSHRHRHCGRLVVLARSCSSPPLAGPTCAAPARCSRETRRATRTPRSTCPPHRPARRRAGGRQRAASAPTGRGRADGARAVWVAPDAEAIGVSRRMFFNRATVILMGLGLADFAAAGFVALPVADRQGRLRRQGQRRQARRHHRQHPVQRRLLLHADGSHVDHRSTRSTRSRRPRAWPTTSRCSPGMRSRHHRRCTRSARTSAAACRNASAAQWFECPCHGSQYNRVGEKKGGPAPRGMDRFIRRRQRHRRRRRSTPARVCPARRSAPTPPAKKLKARTASRGGEWPRMHLPWQPRPSAGSSSSSSCSAGLIVLLRQSQVGAPRARLGDRARRRTASRTTTTRRWKARASSACSCIGVLLLVVMRHRPAAVLGARARPAGRRRQPQGRDVRRAGAASCSRPRPTAASTAPAATAA